MRYLFIISVCLFFSLASITNAQNVTDRIQLQLTLPSGENLGQALTMTVNNRVYPGGPATDKQESVDFPDNSSESCHLTSLSSDGKVSVVDVRNYETSPYGKRPYADFPLQMILSGAGDYTLTVATTSFVNSCFVFARLIDNLNPTQFIDMSNPGDSYTFANPSSSPVTISDRYVFRIYFSSVFKEGVTGHWEDSSNWYGGVVPGITAGDKASQIVIIPEGSKVTVANSSSLNVVSLVNAGTLEIEEGGNLETEIVHMVSNAEFDKYKVIIKE